MKWENGVFYMAQFLGCQNCFKRTCVPTDFPLSQLKPVLLQLGYIYADTSMIVPTFEGSTLKYYPLVMTNSSPWEMALIEIDGLPFLIATQ